MCEICSKCKFGKVVSDPDPDDWFNDDDEAVLCTHPDMTLDKTDYTEESKKSGWIQGKGWDRPGRIVTSSALRPYQVGKYDTSPKGCPLKTNV